MTWAQQFPGSARVSRAGESVPLSRTFLGRLFRQDAETSTRDARATQPKCDARGSVS